MKEAAHMAHEHVEFRFHPGSFDQFPIAAPFHFVGKTLAGPACNAHAKPDGQQGHFAVLGEFIVQKLGCPLTHLRVAWLREGRIVLIKFSALNHVRISINHILKRGINV